MEEGRCQMDDGRGKKDEMAGIFSFFPYYSMEF